MVRDHIKNTILGLSKALDGNPRAVRASPVLGLSFARARSAGTLGELLHALSFAPQGAGVWRRSGTEEAYEECEGESKLGYLTFAELDSWRARVLQRCAAQRVLLQLPAAESMMAEDVALLAPMLGELLEATPDLRVVFAPGTDARAEAALLKALQVATWPRAFSVLVEDIHARGELSPQMQAALVELVATDPTAREQAPAISQRLARRLGQPGPSSADALRAIAAQLAAFR